MNFRLHIRSTRKRRTFRGAPLSSCVLAIGMALTMVGCSSEEDKVVQAWEELNAIVYEHGDDCAELASRLRAFQSEHGSAFTAESVELYKNIAKDEDLTKRLDVAMATVETLDWSCASDPDVAAITRELFADVGELR